MGPGAVGSRSVRSYDPSAETLSAGRWAERSISRAYRRVVRGGVAITTDSSATDLHALRKRCKELRYAIEVCSPVVASGPRKHALAHLKKLPTQRVGAA